MRLWSPHDPYGVAILRKVLIGTGLFLVLYGTFRSTVRDDPLDYYLLGAALAFTIGLFLEWAIALFDRRDR